MGLAVWIPVERCLHPSTSLRVIYPFLDAFHRSLLHHYFLRAWDLLKRNYRMKGLTTDEKLHYAAHFWTSAGCVVMTHVELSEWGTNEKERDDGIIHIISLRFARLTRS
ncbi:hypothetical protein AB6A40_007662 [Gnathostoma spinigerum]|uniref:Uncharacterized protein n=1 Tax=Gnathostoma spinigerum TaxID=75299 RepID=A0ABD6EV75_9BILA